MEYKHFPAQVFNHFIQPSRPTTAQLKSSHDVLRGKPSPIKMVPSLCDLPPI